VRTALLQKNAGLLAKTDPTSAPNEKTTLPPPEFTPTQPKEPSEGARIGPKPQHVPAPLPQYEPHSRPPELPTHDTTKPKPEIRKTPEYRPGNLTEGDKEKLKPEEIPASPLAPDREAQIY